MVRVGVKRSFPESFWLKEATMEQAAQNSSSGLSRSKGEREWFKRHLLFRERKQTQTVQKANASPALRSENCVSGDCIIAFLLSLSELCAGVTGT